MSLYWLTRLDKVIGFLNGFEFLFGALALIGAVLLCIMYFVRTINLNIYGENDDDYKMANNVIRYAKKPTIISLVCCLLFSLAIVFIPTTKEMAAIEVLPKIATKETCDKLKDISKDFVDVAAKWMNDMNQKKK